MAACLSTLRLSNVLVFCQPSPTPGNFPISKSQFSLSVKKPLMAVVVYREGLCIFDYGVEVSSRGRAEVGWSSESGHELEDVLMEGLEG